jgi:hypothetical protein
MSEKQERREKGTIHQDVKSFQFSRSILSTSLSVVIVLDKRKLPKMASLSDKKLLLELQRREGNRVNG